MSDTIKHIPFPEPDFWILPDGSALRMYSYHLIREWEQQQFVNNCDKGWGKKSNLGGAQ